MESTIAQKLDALSKLQAIDSELDEIKKVRGALPDEVLDLEDEVAGYQTRIDKFDEDLKEIEGEILKNKEGIKDAEKLIKKYEEQQMNVRNNREYDAITKEIELQQLEIQILEKRIKEAHFKIEKKTEDIEGTKTARSERQKDLDSKKAELDQIIAESEEDEAKLNVDREKSAKKVENQEERLYKSYNKIRQNARNGLAVVQVKRGACGGCFNTVPPQRQADIRERKKLIVCEHCGRIFSGVDDEIIEEKPKRKTRAKAK